jgi:hypothetical protein
MAWLDRLTDPANTSLWYLLFEGHPAVVSSRPLPPSWITGGRTELPYLDLTEGVRPSLQQLNRKAGAVNSNTLRFQIGPDTLAGTIRQAFATELSTGAISRLIVTLDWTEGTAAAGKIYIADNTDFPASGYVHLGRECIWYNGKGTDGTGDFLTLPHPPSSRAQFGSVEGKYLVDEDLAKGARYVATYPTLWEGRHVQLWECKCSPAGQPLDTVLAGDNQKMVWQGKVSAANPGANWTTWTVQARSIDAVLDTEAGSYMARGAIAWNLTGDSSPVPWNNFAAGQAYIYPGQSTLEMEVFNPATNVWDQLSTTIATGWHGNLWLDVITALGTLLNGTYANNFFVFLTNMGSSEGSIDEWGQGLRIVVDAAGYEIRLKVPQYSPLRLMGFHAHPSLTATDILITSWLGVLANTEWTFQAEEPPPMAIIPANATEILVLENPGEYAIQFPSSGFAAIGAGDESEIIEYQGVTVEKAQSPRVIRLTTVTRGHCGTKARDIIITAEDVQDGDNKFAMATETAQIRSCIAFEEQEIIGLFLKLAMSTGSTGLRHATYDSALVPEYAGAALNSTYFDIPGFVNAALEQSQLLLLRNLVFFEPFNLREWFAKELAFLGYTLLPVLTDSGYQISLAQIKTPPVVGGRILDTSNIVVKEWPTVESSIDTLINRLEMRLAWHPAKARFEKARIIWEDLDSQGNHEKTNTLKVEARGFGTSVETAEQIAQIRGPALVAHFSQRFRLVTVYATKQAWGWEIGDTVRVTLPGIPRLDGGAGWTDERTLLVGKEPAYIQSGNRAACKLLLLHVSQYKNSYWAPCAEVAGVAGAVVTVQANEYTQADHINPITGELATDVQWFEAGEDIYCLRPGLESTNRVVRTIQGIVGNAITLTVAPPGWLGLGHVLTFPTWANASARQRLYVYLADVNQTLGAGNVEAFVYGAG